MMTGTDLADNLEAGVHHLLDLGGEVAVAQLTNQRGVLRSRDQLSTNHSSPGPPWARRWCRCCRGRRTRSPAGERARSGGGYHYCEPIASVLLYCFVLYCIIVCITVDAMHIIYTASCDLTRSVKGTQSLSTWSPITMIFTSRPWAADLV